MTLRFSCLRVDKSNFRQAWKLSRLRLASSEALAPQGSLRIEYHREMVRCSDGGVVALDWLRLDRREADTEAIVLHLPGKVGKYGNRPLGTASPVTLAFGARFFAAKGGEGERF